MKQFLKGALLLAAGTLLCQGQIIAVPVNHQSSAVKKTQPRKASSKANPKGAAGNKADSFPTPSGASANRPSIEDHQLQPTGHAAFDEFRMGIMKDLNAFRHTVVDHYADFLEGEWHEFEPLPGMQRYSMPKPMEIVGVNGQKSRNASDDDLAAGPRRSWQRDGRHRPMMDGQTASLEEGFEVIQGGETETMTKETDIWGLASEEQLEKVRSERKVRNTLKDIEHGAIKLTRDLPGDWLNFHELDIRIPEIEFSLDSINPELPNSSIAAQWRRLRADSVAERVLPEIQKVAEALNLNDYLTYELLKDYINVKFPQSQPLARGAAVHFLMTNLGYDVRLGYLVDSQTPLLLLPSEEPIYVRRIYQLNNTRYYTFFPTVPDSELENLEFGQWRFLTCGLPVEADYGKKIDFNLHGLNLPMIPMEYELEANGIKLNGTVNEAMFPFLANYPQMATQNYSSGFVDQALRDDLCRQVREQLAEMPRIEAINKLLQFTQSAFDYSVDQAYHGFEKPYFVEENLYYPINDCEDRAILFTYLLWNALGVESQLIAYPGHEAAAVARAETGELDSDYTGRLEATRPYGYTFNDRDYYISDPTYIGAIVGDCMRRYRQTLPDIDRHFGND